MKDLFKAAVLTFLILLQLVLWWIANFFVEMPKYGSSASSYFESLFQICAPYGIASFPLVIIYLMFWGWGSDEESSSKPKPKEEA